MQKDSKWIDLFGKFILASEICLVSEINVGAELDDIKTIEIKPKTFFSVAHFDTEETYKHNYFYYVTLKNKICISSETFYDQGIAERHRRKTIRIITGGK